MLEAIQVSRQLVMRQIQAKHALLLKPQRNLATQMIVRQKKGRAGVACAKLT
jgi:hypothetical protein